MQIVGWKTLDFACQEFLDVHNSYRLMKPVSQSHESETSIIELPYKKKNQVDAPGWIANVALKPARF